ncbi:MAG: hypothetical protein HOC74_06335, partial [Gemmatimonadetes bacterium]|nr:hypothetical protein [Gemmatimonadota bacterium]
MPIKLPPATLLAKCRRLLLFQMILLMGLSHPDAVPAQTEWISIKPAEASFGGFNRTLLTDREHQGEIYLLVDRDIFKGEFFKSEDGGESWQLLDADPSHSVAVVDPEDPQKLYAVNRFAGSPNFWWSEDGGEQWETKVHSFLDVGPIALEGVLPGGGAVLFLQYGDQVVGSVHLGNLARSVDGGQNWDTITSFEAPFQVSDESVAVHDIAVDAADPASLYAGAENGLFVTRDGGVSWRQLDNVRNEELAISQHVIYSTRSGALYRSNDEGRSWRSLEVEADRLAVNPANPDIVYRSDCRALVPTGWETDIFRSVDGGGEWELLLTTPSCEGLRSFAFDPFDPSVVYLAIEEDLLKRKFDDPTYEVSDPIGEDNGQELGADPRRESFWVLHRTANLGPQGGNGIQGLDIELERGRQRAFIGNLNNISVVDLELDVVTEVIGTEQMGAPDFAQNFSLAIDESRNELYVSFSGTPLSLIILDLFTLAPKGSPVNLGDRGLWYSVWGRPRPMLVDEERNLLYIGNINSISVVDLGTGGAVREVGLSGNFFPNSTLFEDTHQAINDLELDRTNQRLYAANTLQEKIEVIDLQDFRVAEVLEPGMQPLGLIADPEVPFLYVVGNSTLARLDLESRTVDGQIDLVTERPTNDSPRAVLDAGANQLLIASGISFSISSFISSFLIQGNWEPSARFVVGLDDFRLLGRDSWPSVVQALEINPDGDEVLALGASNLLYRTERSNATLRSVVEIGADPQGLVVSQRLNQVYVARGLQGGFFVVDDEGTIIRTVPGPVNGGLFIDDIADRLYLLGEADEAGKADAQMGVYQLSSLRRLQAGDQPKSAFEMAAMRADHKRGLLWLPSGNGLLKFDLFTGRQLEEISLGTANTSRGFTTIALNADADRAYLGGSASATVEVFDLENERIIDSISLSAAVTDISALELDVGNELLYVCGSNRLPQTSSANVPTKSLQVVDLSRNEVVGDFELGELQEKLLFDLQRRKAYTVGGHIIDLESGNTGGSFTGSFSLRGDYLALNPLTNTLYMRVGTFQQDQFKGFGFGGGGLLVYLGPAGTEVSPPQAPGEVRAEAGDEEVVLAWDAVEDSSLVGYHVYRKDRQDSDFTRITRLPLVDSVFTDGNRVNGQAYVYQVSSVGQGALESVVRSAPVEATPKGGGNFNLLVLRSSVTVVQGDSVTFPLSLEDLEGFDQVVSLAAERPEGIEIHFTPQQAVPPRIVEVKVKALQGAELGRSSVELEGRGGDQVQTASLAVEVTEKAQQQAVLTLELDQEELPIEVPLLLSGRLIPAGVAAIDLEALAVRADTTVLLQATTETDGRFRVEFAPPFVDRWRVSASWTGKEDFEAVQSRTAEFRVTSGQTRITVTSDLQEDAGLGWIATVKGRIYPNPGTVAINLTVRRPDGTEEVTEGVLSSAGGFYGYDLRMDQAGIWEVWASWKGNDRLLGAVSPVITVPVQTDVGRVILLAGGQDSNRDVFWPTSNYLGNLAYTTFQRRRLVKEKIFYLNDRQEQDVDRDGFQEDVDDKATMSAWADAWTWARERVNSDSPLYVYLVGKGQPTGIEIGDGETLTATQLLQDLSALE